MLLKQDPISKTQMELPDGIYKAKVYSIKQKFHGDGTNWSASVLYWRFVTENDHYLYGITGLDGYSGEFAYDPKSKTARWIAECGLEVTPGDALDSNDLIGLPVEIKVEKNRVVDLIEVD